MYIFIWDIQYYILGTWITWGYVGGSEEEVLRRIRAGDWSKDGVVSPRYLYV